MSRYGKALLPVLTLVLAAACHDGATAPSAVAGPSLAKGKPPACGDLVPLAITINDGLAGAGVTSDGQGPYVEGPVGAHLNGATGNLMLWTSQYGATSRFVRASWTNPAGSYQTTDRIYTNNHVHNSGTNACGFKGMDPGTAGTAAFEGELDAFATVRYGMACNGTLEPAAERPVTSRSADGTTWTLAGDNGLVCQLQGKGRNAQWVVLGTAGPFHLTLVAQ
jgi:hypothetical protein